MDVHKPDGSARPGEPVSMLIATPCPMCNQHKLVMSTVQLDLPYFGEALQITVICSGCAFRHSDMEIMSQKEPVRFTLSVQYVEDLSARVVRSASGTIRISELGMILEPGFASDAFVSNIEGIIGRFLGALEVARSGIESDAAGTPSRRAKMARVNELISMAQEMKDAKRVATVILEDPFGNSAIISPRATKEMLSPEEAERLKTGCFEIDVSEVRRGVGKVASRPKAGK